MVTVSALLMTWKEVDWGPSNGAAIWILLHCPCPTESKISRWIWSVSYSFTDILGESTQGIFVGTGTDTTLGIFFLLSNILHFLPQQWGRSLPSRLSCHSALLSFCDSFLSEFNFRLSNPTTVSPWYGEFHSFDDAHCVGGLSHELGFVSQYTGIIVVFKHCGPLNRCPEEHLCKMKIKLDNLFSLF